MKHISKLAVAALALGSSAWTATTRSKNTTISISRPVTILGIALLAGGLIGAAIHSQLEQETHSGEAYCAALGRLRLDQGLCCVLRRLREGDVNSATQQLDRLLCSDVFALDSELASVDAADRAFIKRAFARLTLVGPSSAAPRGRAGQESYDDEAEGEETLAQAAGGFTPINNSLVTLP
jgi:hypothetical protein